MLFLTYAFIGLIEIIRQKPCHCQVDAILFDINQCVIGTLVGYRIV